ncbi:hypothetical protein Dimus_001091 [Dionaea muscipula]
MALPSLIESVTVLNPRFKKTFALPSNLFLCFQPFDQLFPCFKAWGCGRVCSMKYKNVIINILLHFGSPFDQYHQSCRIDLYFVDLTVGVPYPSEVIALSPVALSLA